MNLIRKIIVALFVAVSGAASAEPLRIASLNPIVSDIARQVGGEQVEVIDLMPLEANPHAFYPTPENLKSAADASLVVAAGKGLETYLDEFRQSLGNDAVIWEAGRHVPSLRVEVGELFLCCPAHAAGAIDPHWWHSIKNMKRAARALADELARIDPDNQDYYRIQLNTYEIKLNDLYDWAKEQIASLPRRDRELTTSHAAFGYLCREFGLRSITVQGLTSENNPAPGYLKDVLKTLRDHHVRAVFPEDNANPKVLLSIAREAGVTIGAHLYAGSLPPSDPTYEGMMRYNITTIVQALKKEENP